ncbi:MAG TPA: hypothetical protein VM597_08390 [Gemmataceae bacterium]|jgi:hypothetical protein|nr:hypothetical protein [Gemmataceae bacterium]
MTRWIYLAGALAAAGAGPAVAQYDLPVSGRPANREVDDPKPVYKFELKPEHGEYMVFVKTFPGQHVGDRTVKAQAEGLAEYIRSECRLNAYVFERGWAKRQERRAELERLIAAQKQYYEVERKMPIPEHEKRYKMARIADEYSVFVAPGKGALKTYEEALEFAKYVRKLPPPPAEYCDDLVLGKESGSKSLNRTGTSVNPFAIAIAGRNQSLPKAAAVHKAPKADDFLMKLNSGESYSLVHKAKRNWTLVVKTYGGEPQVLKPGQVVPASGQSTGELLERAGQQARQLAELLRKVDPKWEAFVLHTPYNSIVCVGDFEGPEDAVLESLKRDLAGFALTDKKDGKVLDTLIERPQPVMIPKP